MRFVEVGEGAPVSDDEGTYTAWFDGLDVDAVVVRPDFYVYDACAAQGLDAVLRRLRSVTARRRRGGLTDATTGGPGPHEALRRRDRPRRPRPLDRTG